MLTQTKRLRFAAAAGVLLFLLTACGPSIVRGQSPFVKINGLTLNEQTVSLDLGVRNINGESINIKSMDFVLKARDTELTGFNAPKTASVIANGSENLRFELPVTPAGQALLAGLESGAAGSLPYTLEGSIMDADDNTLDFEGSGHLYPVPGRPGQFR